MFLQRVLALEAFAAALFLTDEAGVAFTRLLVLLETTRTKTKTAERIVL